MRVVIADDAAIVRDGVAALLRENGFDVVATAADAAGLHDAVERHRPDVAVVDIRMPPTHTNEGLVAAERIRAAHPETGVLVLSQHVEPEYALRLLRGGEARSGYLLKDRISDVERARRRGRPRRARRLRGRSRARPSGSSHAPRRAARWPS